MDKEQREQIRKVIKDSAKVLGGIYAESAAQMEELASREFAAQMRALGYAEFDYEKHAGNVLKSYIANIEKGGTNCIERVIQPLGNGLARVSTRRTFVPWLKDFQKEEADEIIRLIGESEKAGVHPKDLARKLNEYFEGTKHRAVNAARTEAQKIRSDVRSARFEEQGVLYVEYITAGDDRVRPEHEARDGKIYRHDDAPWLGEYQCRCLLAPADYKVRMGAQVEPDDSVIIPESEL